jgi:hypothetical protein
LDDLGVPHDALAVRGKILNGITKIVKSCHVANSDDTGCDVDASAILGGMTVTFRSGRGRRRASRPSRL